MYISHWFECFILSTCVHSFSGRFSISFSLTNSISGWWYCTSYYDCKLLSFFLLLFSFYTVNIINWIIRVYSTKKNSLIWAYPPFSSDLLFEFQKSTSGIFIMMVADKQQQQPATKLKCIQNKRWNENNVYKSLYKYRFRF